MTDQSPRIGLPWLQAGQAQKEIVHNEALALLDALVQPVAEAIAPAPPASPVEGQVWIVDATPTGDWTGRAGQIACLTGGGWRFVAPREGMALWVAALQLTARYRGGTWETGVARVASLRIGDRQVIGARLPAIAGAAGGTVADEPARAAIEAILVALRTHGLISS